MIHCLISERKRGVSPLDPMSVERYRYDKAGNMVKKALLRRGRADPAKPPTRADYAITTFAFDGANQLVSSTTDGVTTQYAYDAAGRLVKEGGRTYRYGYLDKVLSVTDGKGKYTYDYHVDGQLASADYGNGERDRFDWDGLALIRRGNERFVNEPHIGGGNPVVSSKGTTYFNDMLGTTIGAKKDGKYSAAALTAFGERLDNVDSTSLAIRSLGEGGFTGKPYVEGLGHAFLFRNYRASLGKWQTADPMGYPDGWNQLAYCGNGVTSAVDLWGCATVTSIIFERGTPTQPDAGGETGWRVVVSDVNMTMRSISVEVVVTVAFAQKLKDSSQFAKGDIVRYTPHSGLSGGVITIVSQNPDGTCVREAVVAHEYGHANYAARTICADLQFSLSLLEAKWNVNQWWSEAKVRQEIDAIINTEAINSMIGFGNAANDPTIAWFQSSSEWRFVHNDKTVGYWEWVKE